MSRDILHRFTVVAAVIENHGGEILLARRPEGTHMAGLWEFPGGKVEPDESCDRALERELLEELGIKVEVGDPLTFAVHRESDLEILLLFFRAVITAGEPFPHEGQELAWVRPADLGNYPTPPADAALVDSLARLYSSP